MKYLVVGLGSMGKRRIRNLIALNQKNIAGFDIRKDRLEEANLKYNIQIFDDYGFAVDKFNPDIIIISTPPDKHMFYAYDAFKRKKHVFIEASVTHKDKILNLYKISKDSDVFILPSCTTKFTSLVKELKKLINLNVIGKVFFVNYHTGQYLPDWHPWEDVKDFYVSNKETGGAREIVPFELTWICDLFGDAKVIGGFKAKLTDMNIDIDDIYMATIKLNNKILLNLSIDVISRPCDTRNLTILGSDGKIWFDRNLNSIFWCNICNKKIQSKKLEIGNPEKGYINPEEPYIEEISCFIEAIIKKDRSIFPNSLLNDFNILECLDEIEKN